MNRRAFLHSAAATTATLALARSSFSDTGKLESASFQKLKVPLLLPGITVSTSATDFYPIQSVQLERFKGESWELFGEIMSAESA